MKLTITKSKNSESFYISKSYRNNEGKSTTKTIRKLGTLAELSKMLNTDRDGVILWAKEQVRLETEKQNTKNDLKTVLIPFHFGKQISYDKQKFYAGGYLFLQKIYYELKLDKVCRKIKSRYSYDYDLNAVLSDLIYTRILDPKSKLSSYKSAHKFLESPDYELHDVYRALDILGKECDFIQSEVYKNSNFIAKRNDRILYYDCTNYYFEIQDEDNMRKYGKSKEHRPNPIIQMGMFMDKDGLPLAFSIFPGNQNEQKSLKPLEEKIIKDFNCEKFIYCSDAGLGSEKIREFNHIGKRAFIVTQSIKKLPKNERETALNGKDFIRISDGKKFNLNEITEENYDDLFYKEIPFTPKNTDELLIITYSPKYAAYQKSIREKQLERTSQMICEGISKKERRNPNDPARFIQTVNITKNGEKADKKICTLDEEKILEEERYDGLYAICTDLLDDDVRVLISISEKRWRIEECFRIMKTEFSARPVYVRNEERIKAHFLICFLSLLIYRILEQKAEHKYTCEQILDTLKDMNFADVGEQGFMPLYSRNEITDKLHEISSFRTDFEFISKQTMKNIQKLSKET